MVQVPGVAEQVSHPPLHDELQQKLSTH